MRVNEIPEIDQLSIQAKIMLDEDLWDNISANESDIPLPQSHISELDSRLERYKSNPGNLLSLEELQARVDSRK